MSEATEPKVAGDDGSMLVHLMTPHVTGSVAGTLVPITGELLRTASRTWLPEFEIRTAAGIVDDDYSLWREGFKEHCSAADPPFGYALVAENDVQGISLFDTDLRLSRKTKGVQVLYVKYLATAPWNRQAGLRGGKYARVGRALVRQAVRESIRCGSPGRIGVHSIANAASFFEKLSFENLGTDALQPGLVYFELRPVAAFSVLTNSKSSCVKGVADALD